MTTTGTIEFTPYHSAIPSWSGYQYQGKVALNVVLDYILKISPGDYDNYQLELEWYEDFCILNGEDYISIHQVKSYKAHTLSEYKDAIWNLLGKTLLKSCKECYLHSTTEIESEEIIKNKLINVLVPPTAPKPPKDPSKSPKIKNFSPWDYYNIVMSVAGAYDEAFAKFSKYTYLDSKSYCRLSDLESEIFDRLKQYYVKKGSHYTQLQLDVVYHYLLGEVDKNVTRRHIKEQSEEEEDGDGVAQTPDRISFRKIIEVLECNWEEPSEEYVILQLRRQFHGICDNLSADLHQYIMDNEDMDRLDDLLKVEEYVRTLGALNNFEFFTFCQMVTPHIHINKANAEAYRNLIPKYGMDVLVTAFFEIKQKMNTHDYKYIVQEESNNIVYLPTTIKLDAGKYRNEDRLKSTIASNILSNAAIRNNLYEIEVMITDNINSESLVHAANKFTDIDDDADAKSDDKITKIKRIRLIDINTAKGELN
ncbi:ABC-three component system protein [Paenibacillus planticolens]|uniref:ABC-three component systems C-terminal domain-containing protein n=1 Tax=Paenibacillus planticolens TaxID=2654976 RepID=A0ABX1ZZ86_9BACL|nr:ABC-three component system protein [Paenibacillus planticolens]NOV04312.1 hypothetical protein [Paenibacillus planticolens]